ncbi:MAG: hypothetical protein H0T51_21470 [Pirellulales bacterium]|nr:hypothetical protein [Pirellulales bacterium]
MSDSADDIAKRMQDVRREVGVNVQGIRDSAKSLSDWRYYVKNHPWMCVGAVAALGFLIVPKRKSAPTEDAKELVELLKKHNLNGAPTAAASKGLAATVIGMAAPFVVRAATQAAQQYFKDGSGPLAAVFSGLGKARPGDQAEQTDDEGAFQDFNIPR